MLLETGGSCLRESAGDICLDSHQRPAGHRKVDGRQRPRAAHSDAVSESGPNRTDDCCVAPASLDPVGPGRLRRCPDQIAAEQLELGLDVIVECVNPVAVTRDGWVGTATAARAAVVEVELRCSDLDGPSASRGDTAVRRRRPG